MKARKQLCVLGTHPNLVPEVTGTMQNIKETCREEKQTLTKSELEKQVSTMRLSLSKYLLCTRQGIKFPFNLVMCVCVKLA